MELPVSVDPEKAGSYIKHTYKNQCENGKKAEHCLQQYSAEDADHSQTSCDEYLCPGKMIEGFR